jgi:Chain length determinant protein
MPRRPGSEAPPQLLLGPAETTRGPDARLRAIWRARYAVTVVTLLAAVLTYLVSRALPGTYRSSAEVLVTTLSPTGATQASVEAANDLAAQYAQQVLNNDVLDPSAASLHTSSSELHASVSAGTVSAENLISIAAHGSSAAVAEARANAVASRFVAVQQAANNALIRAFEKTAYRGSAALQQEISSITSQLYSDSDAARLAAESELPLLLEQRAKDSSTVVLGGAEALPTVSVFAAAGPGAEILPRPSLYALLALVIAFLISCQVAVIVYGQGLPSATAER